MHLNSPTSGVDPVRFGKRSHRGERSAVRFVSRTPVAYPWNPEWAFHQRWSVANRQLQDPARRIFRPRVRAAGPKAGGGP